MLPALIVRVVAGSGGVPDGAARDAAWSMSKARTLELVPAQAGKDLRPRLDAARKRENRLSLSLILRTDQGPYQDRQPVVRFEASEPSQEPAGRMLMKRLEKASLSIP